MSISGLLDGINSCSIDSAETLSEGLFAFRQHFPFYRHIQLVTPNFLTIPKIARAEGPAISDQ
jgi:hypothetical protein